jgi:shikimate kinase
MRICLLGMPGCGKSLTGKKLSEISGLSFIEIDEMIENKIKMTITDIFRTFGEDYFRNIEREIFENVIKNNNVVISTGGGLACFFDTMKLIKEKCFSVYLYLNEDILFDRLSRNNLNNRPHLSGFNNKEIKSYISKTIKQRESIYKQADLTVNADDCPENISRFIMSNVKNLKR